MSDKTRVAILGGGLGGVTAAYYLSSTPELRQKYQVTLYQQGWRLGGKAASGRDQEIADRIYEHGLHMLMGFYENTFHTMRKVYSEWAVEPDNPFQDWTDAFKPRSQVTLQEKVGSSDGSGGPGSSSGEWKTWNLNLPPRPGTPGDGDAPWNVVDYAEKLLVWILEELQKALGGTALGAVVPDPDWPEWVTHMVEDLEDLANLPGILMQSYFPDPVEEIFKLLQQVVKPEDVITGEAPGAIVVLLDQVVEWLEAVFDSLDLDDFLRRLYLLARLGFAVVRGLVCDVLPWGVQGFDRINKWDMKEWIRMHGANEEEVYFSPPVQAIYDLAFAWMDGRTNSPDDAQVAAGAGIKAMLKMTLAYKGAPLWEMMAGMGDTIFSPCYEVCKANGVEFKFFHRVKNLGLTDTGNSVSTIELWKQADIVPNSSGEKVYEPLFDVKGLPCWPSEPFWDQLEDGSSLKTHGVNFESYWDDTHVETITLQHGVDFDLAVLAIPPGAHPIVASELIDRNDAFRAMVHNLPTVATASVQLWLKPDLEGLGWDDGETVMTTYVHPLESWGEMSHVLAVENWPDSKPKPKSVEYFCGALNAPAVLPDGTNPDYPADEKQKVKDIALDWFSNNPGHIWPDVTEAPADPGDPLKWDTLIDWQNRTGQDRFDFQYWRANVDPSERYVLTPPGSVAFRLHAGASGFYNLYLAGDWVLTSINGGSAEAAVEGGMRAARAICGVPEVIWDDPYA